MRKNHNNLKTERKTLRNTSLSGDTNKFRSKKERLCLRCGKKFSSECPYNRLCEKCSLKNEKISLKTYSVSSKYLGGEDLISRYFSA
jgi:hypothetical protein